MGFFRNMTFPRLVILLSFLGSAALGWLLYRDAQRLERVHDEVAEAPDLGRRIQVHAQRLRQLNKKLAAENLQALEDAQLYIRSVAQSPAVDLGNVSIDPDEDQPSQGIVDKIYRIEPDDRKRGFDRLRIANFLYELEAKSRRLRVTHLKLQPVKNLKPHEVGPDAWTYEVEITSRQRVDT